MKRLVKYISACLLLAFVIACGAEDIIINSLDYASHRIYTFDKLDREAQDRYARGFTDEGTAFRVHKAADKSTPEKKKAARNQLILTSSEIFARNFTPVSDPSAQTWINDVLFGVRLLLGLPPATPGASPMPSQDEMQALMDSDVELNITTEQAKEFERKVKGK